MEFSKDLVHFFVDDRSDFIRVEDKECFLQWEFVLLPNGWRWAYIVLRLIKEGGGGFESLWMRSRFEARRRFTAFR